MPRPKRSKVAPSVPAPRPRNASKTTPAKVSPTGLGQDDQYDISDPEEGRIVSASRVKRNSGKGKELQIERAVRVEPGPEETPPSENGRIPGIPTEASLLADVNLDSSSPSVEIGRRDRSTRTIENSVLAIGNFKRRPRQSSILGRGPSRARSSSVESNLADGNGLMSVGRKNHSMLGQSAMGQQRGRVRSSSIGLEMAGTPGIGSAMRIGNFKRRAREPSILGTARKKQQERVQYDDDEDDFNPDDESTPLNLSKTKNVNTSSAPSSSNSRKRKLSGVQVPQSQTRSSTALRQDVDPEIIPASGHSIDSELDAEDSAIENGPVASDDDGVDREEDQDEAILSSPSQQLPIASIEGRSVTPEPFSETMAPPQSSSSSPSHSPILPPAQAIQHERPPSRGRRPLRGQTPITYNQYSPPSSPPSLTHSPNRPVRSSAKSKNSKQPEAPSKLSTAQLQALLPRRRQRTRNEFDIASSDDEIDVSGLAPDDDELTHSTVRAQPRRNATSSRVKEKSVPRSVPKGKAAAKRTYGSKRAASDKENDEDQNDSLLPADDDEFETSQALEKRVGKELKQAVKKFAEVDKWEMEFEDVTASSSSPRDAR